MQFIAWPLRVRKALPTMAHPQETPMEIPHMHFPAFGIWRRNIITLLCGVLLIGAPALAETVKGNGVIRTQARNVSGFTGVGLGISARVEVRQGDAEGVTIEADENLLPLIETSVKDGTLEIKPARRNLSLNSKTIKVVVQARRIDSLSLGGSGSISADSLRAGKLSLEVGGSGTIDLKRVQADKIAAAIGGSGDVKLAGAAQRLDISIGGSGDIAASALVADQVAVSIGGSGSADVAARKLLDVTIAGSGSVNYSGDPKVTQTTVGVGHIKRVGPLPQ
jgi:hypothetical protein